MLNSIHLIGNVGRDPELKESGETKFCKFSLATSTYIKNENVTEWHNVTCFGKTAENVARFVKKGSLVYVEGRVQSGEYTNKEGQKVKTFDVIAREVKFLDRKEKKEDVDF